MLFFMRLRFDLFQCHVALIHWGRYISNVVALAVANIDPMLTVMIFFIADLDCKKTLWSLGSIVQLSDVSELKYRGFRKTSSEYIRVGYKSTGNTGVEERHPATSNHRPAILNWGIVVIFIFVFNIFLSEQDTKIFLIESTLLLKCKTFCTIFYI